ncbi:uncharacterized protein LOC144119183 [Amblyomma americanum]
MVPVLVSGVGRSSTSTALGSRTSMANTASSHIHHAPPANPSWPHQPSTLSLMEASVTTAPLQSEGPAEAEALPHADTSSSASRFVEALSVALSAALGAALVAALWIYVFQLSTTAAKAFWALANESAHEAAAPTQFALVAPLSQQALAATAYSSANETGPRNADCGSS